MILYRALYKTTNTMKQILQTLALALLLPFAGSAQNLLTVSGIVTDEDGPIQYANITITTADTPALPGVFIDAVWTDENGMFTSETDLETPYDLIQVYSDSCGYLAIISINGYPSTTELQISCTDTSGTGGGGGGTDPECEALFIAATDSIADGILYFYNMSEGENLSYEWTFGDGTMSTEQYPTHIYEDDEAEYEVCLYVYNTFCVDTLCMIISGTMDGDPNGSGIVGVDSGNNAGGHVTQHGSAKSDGFQFVVLEAGAPLGIKDQIAEIGMSVYPNPANGVVNLILDLPSQETGEISVMDLTGKVVFQIGAISNKQVTLDLSSIPNGIYLVQFKGSESIATSKIVLQ